MTLESLTVDQLGALCGLERNSMGEWTLCGGPTQWSDPCVLRNGDGWLAVAGKYPERISYITTEHAALLALARHMNLTPKDDTVTTYKRIERDSESNDYDGYVPKAGDVWGFHGGQRWLVAQGMITGKAVVGPAEGDDMYRCSPSLLSLTSHIERPVRTVTVPKEGYVPRVGDRLCGPEGVVLRVCQVDIGIRMVSVADPSWSCWSSDGTHMIFVNLCHHIERDEG